MALHLYQSIITLSVNALNAPIKKQRVADCIIRWKLQYAAYERLINM